MSNQFFLMPTRAFLKEMKRLEAEEIILVIEMATAQCDLHGNGVKITPKMLRRFVEQIVAVRPS